MPRDINSARRRPLPQYLQHCIEPEDIGVHPEASDHSVGCVRQNAMNVTLGDAADMDFHIWQACALDAVFQGVTGGGEPRRGLDKPVGAFIHALIDAIDRLALDVGVEYAEMIAVILCMSLKHGVELGGSRRSVDLRFSPTEERQVGTLHQ